uniref:Uncharacterized protein n=1 Tax=Physcomitrium patens TaxID=3218 RepID=A0A2K1KK39_PHYPA|nr:hypothetical protein PHYPA_007815 [Physcomitrium patens]
MSTKKLVDGIPLIPFLRKISKTCMKEKYIWIYFLKFKSETLKKFMIFKTQGDTILNSKLKSL